MIVNYYNYFQNISNNLNFEILESGFLYADSEWEFHQVKSPFNRLYFVLDGEGIVENDEHHVVLKPGNIYLVPINSCYNYSCSNNMEKFYIHFRMELMAGQDICEEIKSCISMPIDPITVNELLYKVSSNNIVDIINSKSLLQIVICDSLKPYLNDTFYRIDILLKYKELYSFIKNNCTADISIHNIAKMFNIAYSHLCNSFKKDTGETLKSYIARKLIQEATEKLILTDLSIKEIAYHLKFHDEFYFSRFFKKHTGVSPRKYRLLCRLMPEKHKKAPL